MRGERERPKAEGQRLQQVAREQKIDELSLLEAVLVGVTEAEVLDKGRRYDPGDVAKDTLDVCQRAWSFFNSADAEIASNVRGCSTEMVLLGARMAQLLEALVNQYTSQARHQEIAREAARKNLEVAFERGSKLRDQARRILAKVAVGVASRTQLNNAALARSGDGSVVDALRELSGIARLIMSDEDPVQQKRVQLFSLDDDYVESLEHAAHLLREAERALAATETKDPDGDTRATWCASVCLQIMLQVLDAFLVGHELDPSVPLLRPSHLESLMPQLSLLPPPMRPRGLNSVNPQPRLVKKQQPLTSQKPSYPKPRRGPSQPPAAPPRRLGSRTGPFRRGD
jgi:hypothetical protein